MEMEFILVCSFSLCLLGLVAFGCVISQCIMVLGRSEIQGKNGREIPPPILPLYPFREFPQ